MSLSDELTQLVNKGDIGKVEIALGRVIGIDNSGPFAKNRRVDIDIYGQGGEIVRYNQVPVGNVKFGDLGNPMFPEKGRLVVVAILGRGNEQGFSHNCVIISAFAPSFDSEIRVTTRHEETAKSSTPQSHTADSTQAAGASAR